MNKGRDISQLCLLIIMFLWLFATSLSARQIPLTILHTSAIRGQLLPQLPARPGGLLCCATAIRNIRQEQQNVLLLDCGDFSCGAPATTIANGKLLPKIAVAMKYDAMALGIHAWDNGPDSLLAAWSAINIPLLACNITGQDSNKLRKAIRPFAIFDIDGLRIAVVGLTPQGSALRIPRTVLGEILFQNPIPALQETMLLVRQSQPDISILLLSCDYRIFDRSPSSITGIARRFPEFDIILGGRSCDSVPLEILGDTLFSQTGCRGSQIGQVQLAYDTVQKCVTNMTSELIDVSNCIPDATLLEQFSHQLDTLYSKQSKTLSHIETVGSQTSATKKASGTQLVGSAILNTAQADVAIVRAKEWHPVTNANIKEAELYRIVPWDDHIAVVMLTPNQVCAILKQYSGTQTRKDQLVVCGMIYDKETNRLLFPDGTPPHGRERLAVAIPGFLRASGGGRYPLIKEIADEPRSRSRLLSVSVRDALRTHLENRTPQRDTQ